MIAESVEEVICIYIAFIYGSYFVTMVTCKHFSKGPRNIVWQILQ